MLAAAPRPGHRATAPARAGDRAGTQHHPGDRTGRQLRAFGRRTTCAPSTSPTTSRPPTGFRADWERQIPGVPLVIVESPYRSLVRPFLAYLDVVAPAADEVLTIVVMPGVRGAPLVGAAAVQPALQPDPRGAHRSGAHRRRQRALPPGGRIASRGKGRDMTGGRRPLQGRKPGDRRVRVERPHAPYFRYTGHGRADRQAGRERAATATGRALGAREGGAGRTAAGDRRGDRGASVEEEGAGDLQLGRHQLQRLRHRGDPARPRGGRRVGALPELRDRHRHRPPAGRRLDQLPPDRLRLPERRRRLRRGAREPGPRRRRSWPRRPCSSTTS